MNTSSFRMEEALASVVGLIGGCEIEFELDIVRPRKAGVVLDDPAEQAALGRQHLGERNHCYAL
jgi:hypothetical protein